MPPFDLLTTKQVADRLGVTVKTVHRWVETGKLAQAAKLGEKTGARLFDPSEVGRFETERATEATEAVG